jgi:hypothetical protein
VANTPNALRDGAVGFIGKELMLDAVNNEIARRKGTIVDFPSERGCAHDLTFAQIMPTIFHEWIKMVDKRASFRKVSVSNGAAKKGAKRLFKIAWLALAKA